VMTVYGIPLLADQLAPFVPAAVERRMGEAVDKQVRFVFGGRVCSNPQGQAAFAELVDKLKRAGDVDVPFDAQVLSSPVPNAFALPGGKIYLFDGLLQKAQSPDELAGVIAHELGHVRYRDNMRRIIQTGGTSFLLGLLFGDVTGAGAVIFVGRSMFDASYSREAERRADAFTIEVMHKLGRSPRPMGELLFRVTGAQADKSITIFASHPLTEERLATMRKEDRPSAGAEILSASQWRALKAVCRTS
jgi:predicted Zn-dependent protease